MNKFIKILTVCLFLNVMLVQAEENYLNIDAKHFESITEKNILHFEGDVKMTKNNDLLLCQKLIINTKPSAKDPNKQVPKDYKATGNVSFTITTANNTFKGKGDIVYYYPDDQKYIIIGNGYLEDLKEGKKINAEKIYIDELTGRTKIDGGKNKPIKFQLRLEEKKEEKVKKVNA